MINSYMWSQLDRADAEDLESRILWLLSDTVKEKEEGVIETLDLYGDPFKQEAARELVRQISGNLMRMGNSVGLEEEEEEDE